jgi:hypothetical protein
MKETGILFTPENHRLILSGAKRQTRRVVRFPQPRDKKYGLVNWQSTVMGSRLHVTSTDGIVFDTASGPSKGMQDHVLSCPQGGVGDRLYVKEGVIVHASIPQLVGYYMDGCRVTEHWEKRLTAMFMPRWAARTWLEITDVRVQKLDEISEEDSIAEGIIEENVIVGANCNGGIHREETAIRYFPPSGDEDGYLSAVEAYEHLWDSINRKKHPWRENPWAFAITFKRL